MFKCAMVLQKIENSSCKIGDWESSPTMAMIQSGFFDLPGRHPLTARMVKVGDYLVGRKTRSGSSSCRTAWPIADIPICFKSKNIPRNMMNHFISITLSELT